MTLFNKIIGRVNIVNLIYRTDTDYDTVASCYAITGGGFEKKTDLPDKNAPNIVVITGVGVISKKKNEMSESLYGRLSSDVFLSNVDKDGTLSFVRKQQLENLSCRPVIMLPAPRIDIDSLFDSWNKEISFKLITKFSCQGEIVSRAILSKIRLPVLLLLLSTLLANYFLTGKTRDRYARNQYLLNALKNESLSVSQHRNIDYSSGKIDFAYLADRIGASVPSSVTLTALSMQPVTKKIETCKEIQFIERCIVLSGYAADTESITEFVHRLNNYKIAEKLTLSSIVRNTEKKSIDFKITLQL